MAEKLSQQPAAQVGTEADFGMVVQSGQTRRQTRPQLRAAILSAWQGFIGTFLGAANTTAARAAIGAIGSGDNITGSAAKLTTARNIALTGDAVGSASFDGSANASIAATVNRKVGADYISGLSLQWVSANALTVSTGAAYIASTATVLTVPAAIAKTGLVLSATTKYHVYLFDNAGTPDIEIVTTAPSAKVVGNARTKTGDTTRRYLGSIFTAAANTIIRFKHSGNTIFYLADYLAAPFQVLTNGTATTSTNVSLAGCVPETTVAAKLALSATHTNAVAAYVNDTDMGAVSATNSIISSGPVQQFNLDTSVSVGAQSISYIYPVAPTGGGLYIRVQGYIFER